MTPNPKNPGFSNVDSSHNPQFYVDCLHQQYASDPLLRANKQRTLELTDLHAGHTVLDAGCGVGLDAIQMAIQVGPSGCVRGIDHSQRMVAAAASNAAPLGMPITFINSSIYRLPFPDCTFDRCRADKTFQHLSDPQAALTELVRVTRPDGKLVIADPDHDSVVIDTPFSDITQRFIRFRSEHMPAGGIAHRLYGLCKALGLKDVHLEPLPNVYTDYEEKKITSPYLDEIWYAQELGVLTRAEAERWVAYLQHAIASDRFLSMQTYIITTAIKP